MQIKRAVAGGTAALLLLACARPVLANTAPVPPEIPVALLIDVGTGQRLFAREENRRLMPASVVKVMTAYTAFRLVSEGRISTGTRVSITPELEKEWSGVGSTMFLKAGDTPTFGELILGATTVSGNDASVAIAQAAAGSLEEWLALMNENAAALGMRNTHFGSANGYPDEGRTFTTAHDLALLGSAIVTRYPDLYRRYFGHRTLRWRDITQRNHDPVTGRVPGADGMKTGFTNEAGYTFLGSAERDGRRLVMVLAGAPTSQMRDEAARNLLEWGFSGFSVRFVAPARASVGEARVQDGSARKVALVPARDVRLAIPRDTAAEPVYTITYRGPLAAPIRAGQEVARLHVRVGEEEVLDMPLLAAEDVAQAGFFARIFNGIAGIFG